VLVLVVIFDANSSSSVNGPRLLQEQHVRIFADPSSSVIPENIQPPSSLTSNYLECRRTPLDRIEHTQLAAAAEISRMVTSEKVKKAYERNKKLGD
jgi:hypothetical protein